LYPFWKKLVPVLLVPPFNPAAKTISFLAPPPPLNDTVTALAFLRTAVIQATQVANWRCKGSHHSLLVHSGRFSSNWGFASLLAFVEYACSTDPHLLLSRESSVGRVCFTTLLLHESVLNLKRKGIYPVSLSALGARPSQGRCGAKRLAIQSCVGLFKQPVVSRQP